MNFSPFCHLFLQIEKNPEALLLEMGSTEGPLPVAVPSPEMFSSTLQQCLLNVMCCSNQRVVG
jgi:hypothetical protein